MMAHVGHHRSFLAPRPQGVYSIQLFGYVAKGGKRTTRPVTTLYFT